MNVEIIDFTRPDSSRKNLFITNIPTSIHEDDITIQLRDIFDPYGLVYRVQVYPTQWKSYSDRENCAEVNSGYYAFVTFYSSLAATKAKDSLNGKIQLDNTECKVMFAKRKSELDDKKQLYFTKCYELINFYLGFNSWSTNIKTVSRLWMIIDKNLFEDEDGRIETSDTKTVRYVCMIELNVHDLKTDGIGVWQETFLKTDPLSKIQACCKCKKLCHIRAIENAFSKVLLVVLGNGKVSVEIDTTKPEFRNDRISDEQLIKVNDLDKQPETEADLDETNKDIDMTSKLSANDMDDINIHILQELEDDM